jgi:serpin B
LPRRKLASGALVLQFLIAIAAVSILGRANSATFDSAAKATNEFGLDLYHKVSAGEGNLCLSPYSIECALAMTYGGADGETRTEMARILHFPKDDDAIHGSFAALDKSLEEMAKKTGEIVQQSKKFGGPSEPITLAIADRLFAQRDYEFRAAFLALMKDNYRAPLEPVDFKHALDAATKRINDWVAQETRDRIRDLIPQGALSDATRLVLANAIYLKAPWAKEFNDGATEPKPFHGHGAAPVNVSMMSGTRELGYSKRDGFVAVAIPYVGAELQFLILLPDKVDGLRDLESKLSAEILTGCAKLPATDVDLHFPKFKLEPPTVKLSQQLQELGMKSAFNVPRGSANFDRMALRKPNDYLAISEVFHKTFIAVDEKGTEAAAATAVAMVAKSAMLRKPEPIEVNVDHPFLYAIQHVPSGACLFIGRVTDPHGRDR